MAQLLHVSKAAQEVMMHRLDQVQMSSHGSVAQPVQQPHGSSVAGEVMTEETEMVVMVEDVTMLQLVVQPHGLAIAAATTAAEVTTTTQDSKATTRLHQQAVLLHGNNQQLQQLHMEAMVVTLLQDMELTHSLVWLLPASQRLQDFPHRQGSMHSCSNTLVPLLAHPHLLLLVQLLLHLLGPLLLHLPPMFLLPHLHQVPKRLINFCVCFPRSCWWMDDER